MCEPQHACMTTDDMPSWAEFGGEPGMGPGSLPLALKRLARAAEAAQAGATAGVLTSATQIGGQSAAAMCNALSEELERLSDAAADALPTGRPVTVRAPRLPAPAPNGRLAVSGAGLLPAGYAAHGSGQWSTYRPPGLK